MDRYIWTEGLFWVPINRPPFLSTLHIQGFIYHGGEWLPSQLQWWAWVCLWMTTFRSLVLGVEMIYSGGFSSLPTEFTNPNKSLTANLVSETWGKICSFPEQTLGKMSSLLRKGHRKKRPLPFLNVVVSQCGAWNGCGHFTKVKANAKDGGVRGCKELGVLGKTLLSLPSANSKGCPFSELPAMADNAFRPFPANYSQVFITCSWKTAGSERMLWLGLRELVNQIPSPGKYEDWDTGKEAARQLWGTELKEYAKTANWIKPLYKE